MRYFRILLIVFSVSVLFACNSGSGSSSDENDDIGYTAADMDGVWNVSGFGSDPDYFIDRGEVTYSLNGNVSSTLSSRLAGTGYTAEVINDGSRVDMIISPEMTIPGTGGASDENQYFGFLDYGKTIIPYFNEYEYRKYFLGLELKRGSSYALSDLQGEWEFVSVSYSGIQWFAKGAVTAAANGEFTGSLTNNSEITSPFSGTFGIDSTGLVTVEESFGLIGWMDAGKTVFTLSYYDEDSPQLQRYYVFAKKPASVSPADFQTTWSSLSMNFITMYRGWSSVSYGIEPDENCIVDSDKTFQACVRNDGGQILELRIRNVKNRNMFQ
ncbi:hypothetical protein EP073_00125 [Geovibrio thiophilus]|uniref:Lipocalin-like domain-containing protein n=1 Tax=Geovibrio thiophilus TaxID=139438 RepID=A0A3R5UX14_9BACT|nr:hypothetical protein [Geovibrio thiophilus]QAR31865.1 hypothetical protein EP073_00125 [Geovibrio thiophilus]